MQPMTGKKTPLTTNDIRHLFLHYFEEHQHKIIASSSLVPHNDPTLLFTNAGMVQFKDVFLGKEERPYQRAASSQRCVRAGGKHNDLERVGYTARHHTFFEMLGNFSFGSYFKREAIEFAWFFLTEVLHLPPSKLWVTVFKEDKEAEDIWLNELHIDPKQFTRCGEESNFWSMGSTGPCGPCTEIFYDHGSSIAGGPPGSPDEEGDRYVEIWNLVFMQYDRAADGSMTPLPKPSVDTGMGLERITAVMQGVHNNYDIDLFQTLIRAITALSHTTDLSHPSVRVIADHIRSSAFLITDGITPTNEGRGYVLRRIIRRALRHGNKLGFTQPFFYKLVDPLVHEMGKAYPELAKAKTHIETTLRQEEEQFAMTLSQGLKLFEQAVSVLKEPVIPGETVFKLYDTYGFPVDLTADIARERELSVDLEGFEAAMNEQRKRSRQASQFEADYSIATPREEPTVFMGYHTLSMNESHVIALYHDNHAVESLIKDQEGAIILDKTPFYPESGGQVGDKGFLQQGESVFRVHDTKKQGKAIIHVGKVEKGEFKKEGVITANVDAARRNAAVLNHTATHLLHMVLRQILGNHVIQKGSLVEPERLRFDFSHPSPLSWDVIKTIEQRVNEAIRENHEAIVETTSPEAAIKAGAMALFEEKYGDEVRVVRFGDSIELCGGTHAHHTGNIGLFKITSESGVAAGIRRLEAVTGEAAMHSIETREQGFKQKIQQSDERIRSLEKQLEQLKTTLSGALIQDLISQAKKIHTLSIITSPLTGVDSTVLRQMVDQLKSKLGSAIIVLAIIKEKKVHLIAGVTNDYTPLIRAGDLVNMVAKQLGGKGGGRPDLAEAGGEQIENLNQALESVYPWVSQKLSESSQQGAQ